MEPSVLHIDLAVPQGWHELSDKQLRYAFELIAKGFTSDEIKTYDTPVFQTDGVRFSSKEEQAMRA